MRSSEIIVNEDKGGCCQSQSAELKKGCQQKSSEMIHSDRLSCYLLEIDDSRHAEPENQKIHA